MRIDFEQRQVVYFKILDSINGLVRSEAQTIYNLLPINRWINRARESDTKTVFKMLL